MGASPQRVKEGTGQSFTFACSQFLPMKKFLKVLGVLLVALLLLYVLYPTNIVSREQAQKIYATPESKFMEWKGARIHYTDAGQGEMVLLVHGFGGSFHNFDEVARDLRRDYRVVCVDLPGFGLSAMPLPEGDKPDYIQHYRDFFDAFTAHLHADSFYMVGNSMGGWMSWETAVYRPEKVKKLVLIAAAGYEMEEIAAKVTRLLRLPVIDVLYSKGMPLWLSRKNAGTVYADKSKIREEVVLNNNHMSNTGDNLENMIRLGRAGQVADTAKIKSVQCPTLVMWGKQDEIVPYAHSAKFVRDIAGAQLITYDPCGHCPQMEIPNRVSADLRRFFRNETFMP